MMKRIYVQIVIILIIIFVEGFAHSEMTISQIAKRYSPSVVTIVALDENDQPLSLGSGFFINNTGDIATNHHVLEGSVKAILKTTDGKKGEIIEIIKDDPKIDLLIAKTSFKATNPIPLGDSDKIEVGADIVAIGNPAGLEGTVSKGIVSGIRKAGEFKFIQITSPISPGSSGGPVINMSGNVIGVATAYLDSGQNLNFAMPINYINSLKTNIIKLTSLKKYGIVKKNLEDNSLVKVIDINYDKSDDSLHGIEFSIQNKNRYPIKNIKVFFVYRKHYIEYPEGFLKLIDKLSNEGNRDQYHKEFENVKPIKEWDEVISYSSFKIKDTILPNLGLQFKHSHFVNRFYKSKHTYERSQVISTLELSQVDIRILDYEIVKTHVSTPADLLFK